jgi:hypothetical protein
MDRNASIGVEAQSHLSALNFQHRNYQLAIHAAGSPDNNRLSIPP